MIELVNAGGIIAALIIVCWMLDYDNENEETN